MREGHYHDPGFSLEAGHEGGNVIVDMHKRFIQTFGLFGFLQDAFRFAGIDIVKVDRVALFRIKQSPEKSTT